MDGKESTNPHFQLLSLEKNAIPNEVLISGCEDEMK